MTQRLPASVVGSLGLHMAAMGAYFYIFWSTPKSEMKTISNVDLMIQAPKASQTPLPRARTAPAVKLTPWNFMKMALPAVPHSRLQTMQVKIPETPKALMPEMPKLQEQNHLKALPKMEALEPSRQHEAGPMAMNAIEPAQQHHIQALAAMPALEEVGRHQVANLPQAMALEEQRRQAVSLAGLGAVGETATERRNIAPQAAPLEEGVPSAAGSHAPSALESFLPDSNSLGPSRQMAAPQSLQNFVPESKPKHEVSALEEKKGIEIEGPLAHRKVVSYFAPEFPQWAKDQRILEAEVLIKFWVSSDGEVLPDMYIERTSGYERLDHLAMDSLKKWKFSSLAGDEKQWGIITFRFILEE